MTFYLLMLSVFIFGIGIALVLTQQHIIKILIGIELMLNASNLNLVVFSRYDPQQQGQTLALLVIAIIVCETAVAIAIIHKVYSHHKDVQLNEY